MKLVIVYRSSAINLAPFMAWWHMAYGTKVGA